MSYPPPPQQPGPHSQYPPPGYPPPLGYPPQPPRRRRTAFLVIAIVLGVLAAVALFLMLIAGYDASTCNSGLGELAQAFDQQTASRCSAVNIAHDVLEVVTVVLGIGCLAAAVDYFRR